MDRLPDDRDTPKPLNLHCTCCYRSVGLSHPESGGYNLHKPCLALSKSHATPPISYNLSKWFSCRLLEAVESSGVRKFICHANNIGKREAIKVWVFAPDLTVSSSMRAGVLRVAKVLWDYCEYTGTSDGMNHESPGTDEIELSAHELVELDKLLKEGAFILPESARKFQEWRVALLEKFSVEDLT